MCAARRLGVPGMSRKIVVMGVPGSGTTTLARADPFGVRVEPEGTPQFWAERIFRELRPAFDPKRPTALFIGRYQPFHGGHQRLIEEGLERVGQVCIAVRDTQHTDEKNPLS